VWKLVNRRPVAPHTVALARISGVAGKMDVICSVIVEEEEEDENECRMMGMLLWPRPRCDGANDGLW